MNKYILLQAPISGHGIHEPCIEIFPSDTADDTVLRSIEWHRQHNFRDAGTIESGLGYDSLSDGLHYMWNAESDAMRMAIRLLLDLLETVDSGGELSEENRDFAAYLRRYYGADYKRRASLKPWEYALDEDVFADGQMSCET